MAGRSYSIDLCGSVEERASDIIREQIGSAGDGDEADKMTPSESHGNNGADGCGCSDDSLDEGDESLISDTSLNYLLALLQNLSNALIALLTSAAMICSA